MDKEIRRNKNCIIGLPRCDYVFSSTRTCFIGYGFNQSSLEMTILKSLLEKHKINPEEAGGTTTPAQSAFCAKICSKIINAQFCILLLNNEIQDSKEIPNANVNMEYGLMLGFNKYVIPFQREEQTLPFNVAGLDTIKYSDSNFSNKAEKEIIKAIKQTQQDDAIAYQNNQLIEGFLLSRKSMYSSIQDSGEKNMYNLGSPLGFNLLNDFSGLNYIFFGNFTNLRPEAVLWRVKTLKDIVDGRRSSFNTKVEAGILTQKDSDFADNLMERIKIWILTTGNEEKKTIMDSLIDTPLGYALEVFSMQDVKTGLEELIATSGELIANKTNK